MDFLWVFSAIPANSTPFIVDMLCAIFFPRGLIAYWLYEMEAHPLLIAVFIILEVSETLSTIIKRRKE